MSCSRWPFIFSYLVTLTLVSSHRRRGCGLWWLHVATSARRSMLTWIGASLLLGLRCNKGRNDCRRPSATWKETCSCWGQQGWRTSMEAKESIPRSAVSESCVSKLCIRLAFGLYDNLDVKWDLCLSVWMMTSRYIVGYIFMFASWPCVYLCYQCVNSNAHLSCKWLWVVKGYWKSALCAVCSPHIILFFSVLIQTPGQSPGDHRSSAASGDQSLGPDRGQTWDSS